MPEYSLKVISSNIMLPDTAKINGVSLTTDFHINLGGRIIDPSYS